MNCPHCGMKETTDPTHHRVWGCGSFKRWDTDKKEPEMWQSPACIEIASQKSRADKVEDRARVLEGLVRKMYAEDDEECITNLEWTTVQEVWEVFPDLVPDSYKRTLPGWKGEG